MFEALIITLREGVEAALVLALALAILDRRGLPRLKPALFSGALLALALSAVAAGLATRITYNEELTEGVTMLVGAVLVVTLVVWMWRAAPRMKHEIESGIERATGGATGGALGIFLFAFGMVFREGLETAVFLSAAGFNSQGLGMWIGALIGIALAALFGVLFVRGAFKVPLKPFFSFTSAVLILIALQLVVGGLHELSEAEVLPSSKAEMALIGPFVKNELLLFTLTVALAAGWLLFGPRRSSSPIAAAEAIGPEARLARAARARETAWRRATGLTALVVVGFLTTAFVHGAKVPEPAPATPAPIVNGRVSIDAGTLHDGHLHFYQSSLAGETTSDPAAGVRFFVIQAGNELRACFDACEICGDKGYFEDRGAVVCRNCTSPIVVSSLGRSGGCNPIPLPHRMEGDRLVIDEKDLRAGLPLLKGR